MILRKEQINPTRFDGLDICDYTAGLNELSSFAVITVSQNVKHKVSWSKRSDKYYYVIEGEIKFSIDAETVPLKAGDFCIVKKGSKFSYQNNTEHKAVIILVHTPNFDLQEEVFE